MKLYKILILLSLNFFFNYTLSSGVHVQIVQVCYIGIHVPWWWFAASNTLSSTLGILPDALPPHPLHPPGEHSVCCFPATCSCVLII